MSAENKGIKKKADAVVTHSFFHIPLVELDDEWKEFQENEFEDTENLKYINDI